MERFWKIWRIKTIFKYIRILLLCRKYKDYTIASESANLNQQYIEKEKNKDIVYEMVFHTNGNLCGGWIDNEEILDKYEQDM